MLHLRKRLEIRVPDRLAVLAACALTLTAAAGMLGDAWLGETAEAGNSGARALPVSAERSEAAPEDVTRKKRPTLRLLLFRHG